MPYTETNFLVDHTNITDTINRLWWSVDRQDWDAILKRVFAEDITADYTALFGGQPEEVKATKQVAVFKGLLEALDSAQHANMTVLVDLPQADEDASPPTEVKANCNSVTSLVRKSAEGGPISNGGGYYDYVLIRDTSVPKGQNPWRIKYMKAYFSWITGNQHVLPGVKE